MGEHRSGPFTMRDPLRKSRWAFINWPLLIVVVLLIAYGLVMVRSATMAGSGLSMVKRQLMGVGIGLIPLAIAWRMDYRSFKDAFTPLLILNVILILSPHFPFIGHTAKGATSWVILFGQQFQPSEFAKIVTILMLASYLARWDGKIDSLGDFLRATAMILVPFALILTQPDLGSGLVFVAVGAGMMLVAGVKARHALTGLAVVVALVSSIFLIDPVLDRRAGSDVFLKQYQKNRLLVFIDEEADPQGAGHNLKQSKIAIGSGGFTGKGIGSGTQGNLRFLPEAETDFIFAVVGEELGFAGATLLLGLYLALLIIALDIGTRSRDLFGTLIVAGVISMWTFQILENIGMTIGLMPITGIPLPFMSYGSSFMVANLTAVGILLSVWKHRRLT